MDRQLWAKEKKKISHLKHSISINRKIIAKKKIYKILPIITILPLNNKNPSPTYYINIKTKTANEVKTKNSNSL